MIGWDNICLWLAGALCVGQSAAYLWAGSYAQALVFAAYVLANVGFIWGTRGG